MATVTLTEATFDDTVAGGRIVLVDVWAPWCGPCRRFAPVFEEASAEHPDLVFAKVDADSERELARRLGIRAIPTLLVYRDGVQLRRKIGALSARRLQRLIDSVSRAGDGRPRSGPAVRKGLRRLRRAARRTGEHE